MSVAFFSTPSDVFFLTMLAVDSVNERFRREYQ